jgi:hypothetical protein
MESLNLLNSFSSTNPPLGNDGGLFVPVVVVRFNKTEP